MYTGRTFNRESVYVCGDYMDGDKIGRAHV